MHSPRVFHEECPTTWFVHKELTTLQGPELLLVPPIGKMQVMLLHACVSSWPHHFIRLNFEREVMKLSLPFFCSFTPVVLREVLLQLAQDRVLLLQLADHGT
jgi:hypothetical protein